nr:MAG TPA: hypothetical protein [Caudoviricetes sp.]
MAYNVSKKMNVGHGKIMTTLIDTLFLRKIDAEKTYLPLTGGDITGDVIFKDSSVLFDKDSNSAKIGKNHNGNLDIYSGKNVQFSTNGSTYFVANPSYLSLENKHNNISVELVNEDGSGSPYGGLTIYSIANGVPEMTSAISSGYMNGTPYQDFTVEDGGLFSWNVVDGNDINGVAKVDKNGLTLSNPDSTSGKFSMLKFESGNNKFVSIFSPDENTLTLSASDCIMLNNNMGVSDTAIMLYQENKIHFDGGHDNGVVMYSKTGSHELSIDLEDKHFMINKNGFSGNANTATSASKLSQERTVNGGTDVRLNYKYDGSNDSEAEIGFYACNAKVGNQNNYPYHRIARIDLTSENYKDWSTTLYISQGYLGGGFGICRIAMRTNGTGARSGVEVKWLARNNLTTDFVQIAVDDTINATYADVFVKIESSYASTTVRAFASESRGFIKRTWILVDSEEVDNTTEDAKGNSVECYKSISEAGNELHNAQYTAIITGSDTIAERANRDSNGQTIASTYIANIESLGTNTIKITYGDGHSSTVSIQ